MARKLFLFALFLIAAASDMCAAVRPVENSPEKGSWSSYLPFNSREKKSKIAPQPSANMEETKRSDSIKYGSSVSPEPVKKTPSQASTDSDISQESDSEKHIRTNEIIRYFQDIAHEILESHYIPKVKKGTSMPWTRAYLEEKNIREQYYECSRSNITNRLMRCTRECIENAHELFSSLGRNTELEELCIRRCTNSGKLFIAEKAEQIENYNSQQPRRY